MTHYVASEAVVELDTSSSDLNNPQMFLRDPNGVETTKTAADGVVVVSTTKIQYEIPTVDHVDGHWRAHAIWDTTAGKQRIGDIFDFEMKTKGSG